MTSVSIVINSYMIDLYAHVIASAIALEQAAENERRFNAQRAAAKQRGISFSLDFEEWLKWWESTGHYEDYGYYVMARKGDQGGYEPNNIECLPRGQNSREAILRLTVNPWTPEEDQVVLETVDDAEVSRRLGRTVTAVHQRRYRLLRKNTSPMQMPKTERQALAA